MTWFYLSFADPHRPEGTQFLGGLYIEAKTLPEALTASHVRGLNPGGGVQVVGPIPDEMMDKNVPVADRHRLLSRKELEAC